MFDHQMRTRGMQIFKFKLKKGLLNIMKIMSLSLKKVILISLMVNPAFAVTELESEYYSQFPMIQEKFTPIEEVKAALVVQKQTIVESVRRLNENVDQFRQMGWMRVKSKSG